MADNASTGPIRRTIPSAANGNSAASPVNRVPGATVSKLVPNASNVSSSSAREEAEIPTTLTIAAIPIAIPNADKNARPGRVRNPTPPTRTKSPTPNRPG
ncbi:hypothetical protein GCM10009554_54640 [Kribbella koreensis]|uniref:Uncharacterized protein n=2 Tax=Kribbella TaxID=182639 RepID=A0ABP6WVQ3_9ACTN